MTTPEEKDIETNYYPIDVGTTWNDIVPSPGKPEDNANKREIFAQNAAPTGGYKESDLWFDTDDNNKIYRANSALTWVSVVDGSIAGKITTFRQATIPTALAAGDLWTDTDDNKTYRATAAGDDEISAGEWVQVATLGATFGVDIAGGGTANTQVTNAGYATLYRYDRFGSGADGDKTVSGTETLTTDMNWDDLTVPTGTTLNAAGYRIRVKGILTCAGTGKIINNGGTGGNGVAGSSSEGGAGGTAGAAAPGKSVPIGIAGYVGGVGGTNTNTAGGFATNPTKALCSTAAAGGEGGDGASYQGKAGGAAGAPTGTTYNIPVDYANATLLLDTMPTITVINPNAGSGSGGGGGGNDTSTSYGGGGGGSGACGGYVWIAAKTIADGLNVEAKGGAGGNGGNQTLLTHGSGGGGAGGGGGIIIIIYETIGTYTLTVTGGAHGDEGANSGGGAQPGADGGVGNSYLIQV